MLSDSEVLFHRGTGDLIIEPFIRENLGPNSYDVTLGTWFYREQSQLTLFNPFSEISVLETWGEPFEIPHGESLVLHPGESVLCHTVEFIGGRRKFASQMRARSSYGRSFITVCRCAGMGDVGYFNRWTMEVTNNARFHPVMLFTGMRVAQIVFEEVGENAEFEYTSSDHSGKYQDSDDIEVLKNNWRPEMMLPRLYNDREIRMPYAAKDRRSKPVHLTNLENDMLRMADEDPVRFQREAPNYTGTYAKALQRLLDLGFFTYAKAGASGQ